MGSWLAVNNGGGAVNNGGAPPASPEEEQQAVVKASELRERGAGKEGLTLEQVGLTERERRVQRNTYGTHIQRHTETHKQPTRGVAMC